MKIKRKLSVGLFFLFSVITLLIILGSGYILKLSNEAEEILENNFRSLEYVEEMLKALDEKNSIAFDQSLILQEKNITEPNEDVLTHYIRADFKDWRMDPADSITVLKLRTNLYQVAELNRAAIVRKSDLTQQTARDATVWIGIVSTLCFIISFTLIVNFPGYIANPISQLTESIKAIANGRYQERLNFDSKDEFGELANAFNSMSFKLEEYESSNLAKLLSEKKRIETLINRMHNPIIGLDEDGFILFINKEAEQIIGINAKELTGKRAPEAAASNDLLRSLTRNLSSPQAGGAPLKIFSHGKESFYSKEIIRVTTIPTGELKEKFIGYVILLTDITEFRERDLAKTNFLATVSHELKTPISSIKMGLTLLSDDRIGQSNDEQKKLITTIQGDCERLLKITGELLNLTQIESGNIQMNIKPSHPSSIIQYATNAVAVQAQQKKLKLDVTIPDFLPPVQADPDKSAWVLINFLTNAVRFAPEDSTIGVRAEQKEDFIEFSVKDLGKGIEPRYQSQIFDRYFRAPNAGEVSTGLGLSICKEFIEAQRGTIGVESAVGKGSKFYFRLPLV